VGPSVRWRRGGQQLTGDLELLRFEVADINVVTKRACADSLHYGDEVVTPAGLDPGIGILPLSCFAVTAQWPAERLAAGTNYRRYRKVRATALLDAGLPPRGMLGSRAERADLLTEFEGVLELLGPIVDLDV